MRFIKTFALLAVSVFVFTITAPTKSEAAGMKIVFVDAIWGAALGFVVGTAVWGLRDNKNDAVERFMIRGTSFGILFGMGYGFYEAEKGNDGFVSTPKNQGLFHYSSNKNTLFISPVQLISKLNVQNNSSKYTASVFSMDF